MLVIRFSRGGAKKRPHYHIVVADRRASRDGKFIERLGFCNPVARSGAEGFRLDMPRFDHWLARGAKPSDAVRRVAKNVRRAAAARA
ncbi:MAG: 30S ribosomal protein S16 [Gammaproteobacteria bacterium]